MSANNKQKFFHHFFDNTPGYLFFSAVFDFLPIYVIKYSCAGLVKHNFEFSVRKY